MPHGRRLGAIAAFVALLIVLPLIIRSAYYQHLLITVVMNALLAMTFIVTLRTGLINVAMAGFWGIGAYATALLETKAGISFWVALPVSTVGTLGLALILGLVVVRFAGFGFVILTLVIASIVPVFFGTFAYFGRYVGIINIPRPDPIPLPGGWQIDFASKVPNYYLILGIGLVCVLVLWAFYSSTFGRAWRAIGLSSQLAQSVGISPFRYRLVAWLLSSTIAGAVGSFFAAYSQSVVPGTFGPFKSIYIQIYGILGGMGFVIMGPIVGALVLTLLPEFFRFLKEYEPVFTGAVIILIVIFLPQGLLGLGAALREGSPAIRWLKERLPIGGDQQAVKRRPGEEGDPPGGLDDPPPGDHATSVKGGS
jgi:branched-chain amino acid transport system permease protein